MVFVMLVGYYLLSVALDWVVAWNFLDVGFMCCCLRVRTVD